MRIQFVSFLLLGILPSGVLGQSANPFPPASPETQGTTTEALQEISQVVRQWVEDHSIVGAELLIIKNRRTIWHKGYGMRDEESQQPMESGTIFNIRSMTKTLTGAAAQILIDENKLKLEDKVSKYLPGFKNEKSESITVEQVLTHRSGLPLTILQNSLNQYDSLQEMVHAAGEQGPQFPPDSKFWYSDTGTDVVAALVEVISGTPIDEFIQARLLNPLGMNDSLYPNHEDSRWKQTASLYVGVKGAWRRAWKGGTKSFYPFSWGSQTLFSTPADYARFLAMWMDQGLWQEKRILSKDAIRRTLTPASKMSGLGSDRPMPTLFPHHEVYYGQMSVLYIDKQGDPTRPVAIGHSGSDGTIAWAWPEKDLMVLLFTQSRGSAVVLRLEKTIDRFLLNPGKAVVEMPEEVGPLLGTYIADFGPYRRTEFTVVWDTDHLGIDIPGQLVFELDQPDEQGRYFFTMVKQIFLRFERDEDGKVQSLLLNQNGREFTLPKGKVSDLPASPPLDPGWLNKVVGEYEGESTDSRVEILLVEGELAFKSPEFPTPFLLHRPDKSGRWFLQASPGAYVTFQEKNGKVISITAHSQAGREVRKKVDRKETPLLD